MNKKIITTGLLGGLIIFVWMIIFQTFFPFYQMTVNKISDDNANVQLLEFINENITESGVYYPDHKFTKEAQNPAFDYIQLIVEKQQAEYEIIRILLLIIVWICAVMVIAWMLPKFPAEKIKHYKQRLLYVVFFGVFLALFSDVMNWCMHQYPLDHSMVAAVRTITSWVIAGTFIAWRTKPENI